MLHGLPVSSGSLLIASCYQAAWDTIPPRTPRYQYHRITSFGPSAPPSATSAPGLSSPLPHLHRDWAIALGFRDLPLMPLIRLGTQAPSSARAADADQPERGGVSALRRLLHKQLPLLVGARFPPDQASAPSTPVS